MQNQPRLSAPYWLFSFAAILAAAVVCKAAGSAPQRDRPWLPRSAPDNAAIEAARVRIVDFGTDFLRDGDGRPRHQFHCHRYALGKDEETGLWAPTVRQKDVKLDLNIDVDGDGRTNDDVVAYREFSLQRPFSPEAPWYDMLAGTPRWYGGTAIYQANVRSSGFSEDGVNHEHDGQRHRPRDNWARFHETYEVYNPYRLAAVWIWQKHDFLNGGAEPSHRVTFDDTSRLAVLLQRYFMCVDAVRFLVRDEDQFYLSEATFRLAGVHELSPNRTRWAKYEPQAPHHIYFDGEHADFRTYRFQNVTAVGFYVSKDKCPTSFGRRCFGWHAAIVSCHRHAASTLQKTAI